MKTLIGISGKMRSGKNTAADYLANLFKWSGKSVKLVSFAGPLKDAAKADFARLQTFLNEFVDRYQDKIISLALPPIYQKLVEKNLESAMNDLRIADHNWYEEKTPITRILLQDYGTKIFRERVDQDYWVNKFIESVHSSIEDVVICTDMRFLNEATAVKNSGLNQYCIRVNRNLPRNELSDSISETDLDNYTMWDAIIDNNGSLEELYKRLEMIYEQWNNNNV